MSNRTSKRIKTVLGISVLFLLSALVSPGLAASLDDPTQVQFDSSTDDSDDPVWIWNPFISQVFAVTASAISSATSVYGWSPVATFAGVTVGPGDSSDVENKDGGAPTGIIGDGNPF